MKNPMRNNHEKTFVIRPSCKNHHEKVSNNRAYINRGASLPYTEELLFLQQAAANKRTGFAVHSRK